MTRQILMVVGAALLAIGGSGIVVALVWLTANKVHGTLPYIYDPHAEALLFLLPVLLLTIAIVGASFVSAALIASTKDRRSLSSLHPHSRFHA